MSRRSVQRVLEMASDPSDEERAEIVVELLSALPYPGEEVTGKAWKRLGRRRATVASKR